jgi:surfeit locus 1 family protein
MRGRRHAAFLILNLAVIGLLLGLGAWQLQRLEWKRGLLSQLSQRLAAEPVAIDEVEGRQARGEDIEFLRASASGRFRDDREQYLFTSRDGEVGWQVVTPLETPTGGAILVDRGFVPDRLKDPMGRPEERPSGPTPVIGVVRTHADGSSLFAPRDEPERRIWYSWSPARMGANARLDGPAGFILHAEPSQGAQPWPRASRLDPASIPNNHLQYAFTWFALAFSLIILTLYQLRRLRRSGA